MLPLLTVFLAVEIAPDVAGVDFKQPQLAADTKMVAMTFGAGRAVYFSASHDRGRTFSKPVKVAEEGPLALGRHRGPRIAITPGAIVISAVVGQRGGGADGDLRAWRSTDGGSTWSSGVTVNDVPAAAREGLHAMAAGGGLVFATWLDLRTKGTRLYGAHSRDGGATWSKNVLVYESPDGRICECCHPSAMVDSKGAIWAMWRNALGGSRDMYLARSTDGGHRFSAAEKLGAGTWPLNACPMDGGGLALASDGKVVTVWRRANKVYLAPAGTRETVLDEGKDPAVAFGREGAYVVWSHGPGLRARVPGKSEPVALADEGGYAQVVAAPDGPVLAAWESRGRIVTRALDSME